MNKNTHRPACDFRALAGKLSLLPHKAAGDVLFFGRFLAAKLSFRRDEPAGDGE
jgi:hypothetical protein